MKIKQRPEDFVVREGFRFDEDPEGDVWVYRMDKQKVSTLQALERLGKEFGVRRRALSVAGLKDKQGRTEQLVGVAGGSLGQTDVVQSGDLRLTLIGRSATPISSENITANRFEVTVRDLSIAEAQRVPESVREVERVGVVNYFDSQRFGFLKHGQGFIGRHLIKGDWEAALKAFLATPSELDRSDDAKVKRFWAEHWGQWQQHAPQLAAKRYAPLLRRLREDPTDFKGAFLHIERRTRMMALFELQSFLWNEGVRRYLSAMLAASELVGLRYQAGALVFPRALPPALRAELQRKTFPLLARDSRFDDPQVEAAARGALSAQGLRLEDMHVPDAPQLFFKHEERPLFVLPGKLRVNEPRPDELNRGRVKVNLSFTLPPGAYATLVVRRVLWFAAEGSRALGTVGHVRGQTPAPPPRTGKRPPREAEQAAHAGPKPGSHEAQKREHRAEAKRAARPEARAAARPARVSAWGRPLEELQAARAEEARPPRAQASERAPAPERSEGVEPAPGPQGFLARQRARKAAREQRRAQAGRPKGR